MPLFAVCLIVLFSMLPIGLFLRKYSEQALGQEFNWKKEGKTALRLLREKNPFAALLLSLEGVISNIALVGVVVGIILYFVVGL